MRNLILVFLLCGIANALVSRKITFTASDPLPTTYSSTSNKSLILSEISGSRKHMSLWTNNSSVVCNIKTDSTTIAPVAPTDPASDAEIFLVASTPNPYLDSYPSKNIYCRSLDSAKTAGDLFVVIW